MCTKNKLLSLGFTDDEINNASIDISKERINGKMHTKELNIYLDHTFNDDKQICKKMWFNLYIGNNYSQYYMMTLDGDKLHRSLFSVHKSAFLNFKIK